MPRKKDSRRSGKHNAEAAIDVILRAFSKLGRPDQATYLEVKAVWPKAVGARIAARTVPMTVVAGRLVVQAASATWQQELMYLRQTIVDKVNALLSRPYIRELKVISGHVRASHRPHEAPKLEVVPEPPDVARAAACASVIGDADVRAAFVTLMAKDLRHRRV